jgi:hypothetical protein
VLLEAERGLYFSLDEVGTRIWQLLVEHGDRDRVAAAMLEEFEVDEATLLADLDALIDRLAEAGLIDRG